MITSLYADVLASGKPKARPVVYDPELERENWRLKKNEMGSRNGGKKG